MNKKFLIGFMVIGAIFCFAASDIFAGSDYPENITIEAEGFDQDRYQGAEFSHKKHAEEYNGGYACGDCHHDDQGNALDLKVGDSVQKCIECHSDLKDKRSTESYYNAMHSRTGTESCQACHKAYNKDKGYTRQDDAAAPTGCTDCHARK